MESDFDRSKSKPKLKDTAVPTRFKKFPTYLREVICLLVWHTVIGSENRFLTILGVKVNNFFFNRQEG